MAKSVQADKEEDSFQISFHSIVFFPRVVAEAYILILGAGWCQMKRICSNFGAPYVSNQVKYDSRFNDEMMSSNYGPCF